MTRALTHYRRSMSERQLLEAAMQTAQVLGYLAFHCPDEALAELAKAQRWDAMPDPGFPDLVLLNGDGRLVFAETKSATGQLRAEQLEWAERLRRVRTIEYRLWRPEHRDLLVQQLAAPPQPAEDGGR